MKRMFAAVLGGCFFAGLAASHAVQAAAQVQSFSRETDLQTGRTEATKLCSACHIIAPNDRSRLLYRGQSPSFEDIANRPGTTAESLRKFIDNMHLRAYEIPQESRRPEIIPDQDKSQLGAYIFVYILSLKKPTREETAVPPKVEDRDSPGSD
jgi:hypothetical protein